MTNGLSITSSRPSSNAASPATDISTYTSTTQSPQARRPATRTLFNSQRKRERVVSPAHKPGTQKGNPPYFPRTASGYFWFSGDEVERVSETRQSAEYFRQWRVARNVSGVFLAAVRFFLFLFFGLFRSRQVD